jgi:hypothetical protein
MLEPQRREGRENIHGCSTVNITPHLRSFSRSRWKMARERVSPSGAGMFEIRLHGGVILWLFASARFKFSPSPE